MSTKLYYLTLGIMIIIAVLLVMPTLDALKGQQIRTEAVNLLMRVKQLQDEHYSLTGKYINGDHLTGDVLIVPPGERVPDNKLGLDTLRQYPFYLAVYGHPNETRYRAIVIAEGDFDLDFDSWPEAWWVSWQEDDVQAIDDYPER